ncbi:hypothetical protein ES319_A12G002500v1 [Gossypium barbadense]|uniref:Uncharacterized protein n=1 Tax=Gossypium barbadense TaxID=3634 RepID=A0A5J5T7B7_GOSBA|nr:hypothetical protein ES319_A12G002500v1 [Gossypium barbadense]
MEEGCEILQLYEIPYSDLLLLSSSSASCSHYQERMIMKNLGPTGPGLFAITNVPDASLLRRKLLPLARKLALLSPDDRKRILRDHNLGSDVPLKNPDRNVSSFAMQLKYAQGLCMMEIGLCLARICDRAIGGNELEQSLLESCAAKGRLIHYHSMVDSLVLREAGPKKGSSKRNPNNHARSKENLMKGANLDTIGNEVRLCEIHPNLWQQWHYDYGIFTLLTDPMFLLSSHRTTAKSEFSNSSDQECASPSGHSYLQVFHPNKNKVFMMKASPESFIVQPAWSKTFSISDYPMEHYNPSVHHLEQAEEHYFADQDQNALTQEIQKIVPPLSARLKDGMTFAEFSRETTKQYYGGSGLQSNK